MHAYIYIHIHTYIHTYIHTKWRETIAKSHKKRQKGKTHPLKGIKLCTRLHVDAFEKQKTRSRISCSRWKSGYLQEETEDRRRRAYLPHGLEQTQNCKNRAALCFLHIFSRNRAALFLFEVKKEWLSLLKQKKNTTNNDLVVTNFLQKYG